MKRIPPNLLQCTLYLQLRILGQIWRNLSQERAEQQLPPKYSIADLIVTFQANQTVSIVVTSYQAVARDRCQTEITLRIVAESNKTNQLCRNKIPLLVSISIYDLQETDGGSSCPPSLTSLSPPLFCFSVLHTDRSSKCICPNHLELRQVIHLSSLLSTFYTALLILLFLPVHKLHRPDLLCRKLYHHDLHHQELHFQDCRGGEDSLFSLAPFFSLSIIIFSVALSCFNSPCRSKDREIERIETNEG